MNHVAPCVNNESHFNICDWSGRDKGEVLTLGWQPSNSRCAFQTSARKEIQICEVVHVE